MASKYNFGDGINQFILSKLPMPVEFGPTQQLPEMVRTGNKPVIIYSWVVNQIREAFFHRDDLMVYTVFSNSDDDLRLITNLFIEWFKDYNGAADRVQQFLDASPTSTGLRDFHYDYISIYNIGSIQPPQETSGRASITITLRVGY